MMNFKVKRTKMFFDKPAVVGYMERMTAKVYNRFGGYVRRVARNSIKQAKSWGVKDHFGKDIQYTSQPGSQPLSHTGYLKNGIFYATESQLSVVIGPMLLKRHVQDGAPVGNSTVPEVLEYGGQIQILEYQRQLTERGKQMLRDRWGRDPEAWHRLGKKRLFHAPGRSMGPVQPKIRKRTIRIKPRPYMTPAFEATLPRLPKFWTEAKLKA